jgi:nitroreductase
MTILPPLRLKPPVPEWDRTGPVPQAVMEFILNAGVQAPSGENLQPWLFRQDKDQVELYPNIHTDPSFFNFGQRATLISTGSVLENMVVAASTFGLTTSVQADFSEGGKKNIASLRFFLGENSPDPLAQVIWQRETNRRLFDKRPLAPNTTEILSKTAAERGARLHVITDRAEIEAMAEAVYWADRVRLTLRECHEPLVHAIRKNRSEALARRDGFTFKNLRAGIDGRLFLTLTRPWWIMQWANRVRLSNKVAAVGREGVATSSAVSLLTMPGDRDHDYFSGGQALERVWLTATAQGLALQPIASVVFFWLVWRSVGETPFPRSSRPHLHRAMNLVLSLFPQIDFNREGLVLLFRLGTAAPMEEGTCRFPLAHFLQK